MHLISSIGKDKNLLKQVIDFINGNFVWNKEATKIKDKYFKNSKISKISIILTSDTDTLNSFGDLKEFCKNQYPHIIVNDIQVNFKTITNQNNLSEITREIIKLFKNSINDKIIIGSAGLKNITQILIEQGFIFGYFGYLAFVPSEENILKFNATIEETRNNYQNFNILFNSVNDWYLNRRNLTVNIDETEKDNFNSILLLPFSKRNILHNTIIAQNKKNYKEDINLLKSIPKCDLHFHLGGFGDEIFIYETAKLNAEYLQTENKVVQDELNAQIKKIKEISLNDWKEFVTETAKKLNLPDFEINSYFLYKLGVKEIKTKINEYFKTVKTLKDYMKLGDFGGSLLLQTEISLRKAIEEIVKYMNKENIKYIEIRCSPLNYIKGNLNENQVLEILIEEADKQIKKHNNNFLINFIIIGTRHGKIDTINKHVELCYNFYNNDSVWKSRVCGFDLAGDEENFPPNYFKENFRKLHEKLCPITIHAGEITNSQSIWEALYELHANRIGHGLKLFEHNEMIEYIRDYKTALEMCPSSNTQTNKFDIFPNQQSKNIYPLLKYLNLGIKVTVNTDNTGISQTSMSNELWKAGSLTPNGLSLWNILRIIKNGFKAAFLPAPLKMELLRKIDKEIFEMFLK